ncbi:hypothetical protein BC829DRAFT_240342 [Chytridium lagenaria]|nr:hypothetical protein BC829DRAFT_240342 [Chytridium lagenaria]
MLFCIHFHPKVRLTPTSSYAKIKFTWSPILTAPWPTPSPVVVKTFKPSTTTSKRVSKNLSTSLATPTQPRKKCKPMNSFLKKFWGVAKRVRYLKRNGWGSLLP